MTVPGTFNTWKMNPLYKNEFQYVGDECQHLEDECSHLEDENYHVEDEYIFRKVEDVTTISKSVSHFGEHKRLHLESSKQNYYIISLRQIIKPIFTSLLGR